MKHRGAAEGEARRSDGRVRRASLQVDDLVLDLGRLERRGEARRVDSNREGIDRNRSSRGVVEDALVTLSDTLGAARPEHARARGMEVARVVVDMKAHQIGAKNTAKDLFTMRERSVHLAGGKRRVQKPANRQIRRALTQVLHTHESRARIDAIRQPAD